MADVAVALPRGGVYVRTSAGPVQFGLPPETIKDSMALALEVPAVYVVPRDLFDRRRGINVAECEFPAYYNFFLLKRRIRLVVDDASVEARIRAVFSESLFGPASAPQEGEFDPDYPAALRPDFRRESDHFRRGADGKRLEVDTLVDFQHLGPDGRALLGEQVYVERLAHGGGYAVWDHGQQIHRVGARIDLPARRPTVRPPEHVFVPPDFGVTVLGASHGFDPAGKTTGFILWINGRGLLVDPPVDAADTLREQGLPPKLIDGVILTHCHADHDSGTFQKILEEGRVNVYTTPTILGSFLRKYAALSGLGEDLLRRTFGYHPVTIGAPLHVHGAELRFFYTLHSIPTVGFEVFHGGKSLAFSSDSLYDPARVRALEAAGVLTPERAADLIDFPWHHTLVLHEAGVPPLHTPVAALAALSDDAKARLRVVHIAEKDVPAEAGLRAARVGLEHTMAIEVDSCVHAEAIDVLDAIWSVDLFRDFDLARARDVLHMARRVRVAAGQKIIARGAAGDAFYIVAAGVAAAVDAGGVLKIYQAGDYFGETALVLAQPRNADVVAQTDVTLVAIGRYEFLYLVRGTDVAERLVRLARAREERAWEVLEKNSALGGLTSAQKTQLQSYLGARLVRAGEVLWEAGARAESAFLLDDGVVALDAGADALAPFRAGAFVGEFDALRQGAMLSSTARVLESGRAFEIRRDDLARFFADNPGVLVSFLGTKFVE